MKVAVLTIAFAAQRFIRGCIEQFHDREFDHLVLVSKTPYHGDAKSDRTAAIAKSAGATVKVGTWVSQADHLNDGLEQLKDHDWVLIVDADEYYTERNLELVLAAMRATELDGVTVPLMNVYWKTPEWRLTPDQTDNPIIAARPGNVTFSWLRACSGEKVASTAAMHHFSYVATDEEILAKINSFDHALDFDTDAWYRYVWQTWNPASLNLHPLYPEKFAKAIRDPAPAEIQCRLET